jgi:hypothetical protein
MSDGATAIIATGFFAAIAIAVKSVAGIFRARFESRSAAAPVALEQRLERMEGAIDTIAIEVERIAEAQRYALRLEEERESRRLGGPGAGRAGAEPRSVTPH